MKVVSLLRMVSNPDEMRKLIYSDWSLPPIEKIMPPFFAFLSGLALASAVSFVAAQQMMPKSTKFRATEFADNPVILPPPPGLNEFRIISERNLFNSEGTLGESKDPNKAQCELKKSDLPLKFTGIIFGGTPQTSLVLLESVSTRDVDTFLLHDTVPGEAVIVDILKDRIIFERNGCKEYVDLEVAPLPKRRVAGEKAKTESKPVAANGPDNYREDGFERKGGNTNVERRWVDKALGMDFAKTLQDAKASPNLVGNEVKGFVLSKIRADSVYEKLGLMDNDVVEAINGIELNGMAQAIQTLNAMRNETAIQMVVRRNGTTMTFNVNIKK